MSADSIVHRIEGLESRRLLAAGPSLHHGLLSVHGDNKVANEIVVGLNADDATKLDVSFNGVTTSYDLAKVKRISITGGKMNDLLQVGTDTGDVTIPTTLTGGSGDDTLIGGAGKDVIKGLAGNDSIVGNAGDDKLSGGAGNDTITGDDGKDTVTGDNGDDSISGGAGDDNIKGGAGKDSITGDEGNDKIDGGSGDDLLDGGDGVDTITARSGADVVSGGAGADILLMKNNKKAINVDNDPTDVLKK
jgi:Ca2+-binding RTX toxin-like protein